MAGTGTDERRVTREVDIDGPPEEVWDAVIEPATWLGDDAVAPDGLVPGAPLHVPGEDGDRHGWVTVSEPPGEGRPGRLEWHWWRDDEPTTHVEVRVVAVPAGTRVVVTETLPATAPVAAWTALLARLRAPVAAP